jgi:hypothetical protein
MLEGEVHVPIAEARALADEIARAKDRRSSSAKAACACSSTGRGSRRLALERGRLLSSPPSMIFRDHNDFDAYAKGRGWLYDNSGMHQGQSWDWYFKQGSDGKHVLLRQKPDRAALVRIEGKTLNEVWSGQIADSAQFDEFMKVFAALSV